MFSVYDKFGLQLGKIYTLFWSGENIGARSYGDGPISRLWYNVWLPLDFCVLHLHMIVNPTKREIKLTLRGLTSNGNGKSETFAFGLSLFEQ